MQTINTWSLLHLFGRKIVLAFFLFFLFQLPAHTQAIGGGNYNYFDFQQKSHYFGITLGLNSSRFKPFRSKNFLDSDTIRIVESINGPGFNLGIITNLKIGNYFDLRFLPTLSFAERNINYNASAGRGDFPTSQRKVESVFVEFPVHFRYKSEPFHDIRLFLIGGVKYSFDVASESRARQAETLVKVSANDFSVEYGAGVQFFFPYFIFSPEFKVSHGLGNTLIFNNQLEESTVLEKLLSRTFTISFHFEG